MFSIQTEAHFDSAHFLKDYKGACANLHGHRWQVVVEVSQAELIPSGQERDMVCDFGEIKRGLKSLCDYFDHKFVYERNSLKDKTIEALTEEGFEMVVIDFRPTAEAFARYFFDQLANQLPGISKVTVYETPKNSASYWR